MEQEKESPWQEYMAKHKRLIHLLRELKMPYDLRARLPLFKVFVQLESKKETATIKIAMDLIKDLVVQRRLGREPAHKWGRYV